MNRKMEKGEVQIVKMGAWSGGPGCHGGCGVEVHIQDGRVIKVEGDPDHPFLQGRTCPRVLAMTQLMYHPDRLKYPLKRVGERGKENGPASPGRKPMTRSSPECRRSKRNMGPSPWSSDRAQEGMPVGPSCSWLMLMVAPTGRCWAFQGFPVLLRDWPACT